MRKSLLLAVLCTAAHLSAQNCQNLGISAGNGDDVMLAIQPIGFVFPFAGATYTDVHICTNGYVHLSNAGVPTPTGADGTATVAEFGTGSPRIAALWTDLNMITANGGFCYIDATLAKCTITWKNAVTYGTAAPLFDVQMELYPNGEVRFYYEAGTTNNSTFSAAYATGLTGMTPGGGVTLPAASDLSVAGVTADNSLFEFFAVGGTFDLAANSLMLLPTSPGWVHTPTGLSTNCANSQTYGTGCVTSHDSFYELMAAASFDLAGTTMTMLRSPTGYTVLNSIPGTLFTHVTPTVVADADDVEQTVGVSIPMPVAGGTTSSLTICSNGRIALSATGNGTAFTPAIPTFLAYPQTTIAASWHDYGPHLVGSGDILFEEVGGIAYVTWNNVYSFGTTLPNQFQYQFDLASGNVQIVYGAFTTVGGGNNHLVGYSIGAGATQGLALDLSVALATPVQIADVAASGLTLAISGSPIIGSSFNLDVTNVPAVSPAALLFFGSAIVNPGVDLTFLNMPGCFLYSSLDLGSVTIGTPGGSGTAALAIPPNPAFAGITLSTQAVSLTLANLANLASSNGAAFTAGF